MENNLDSTKEELFLDANILIELVNMCERSNPQSIDDVWLLNLGGSSFAEVIQNNVKQLVAVYEDINSKSLYVTAGTKKQVRRNNFDDLVERVRNRFIEHAFIQISPQFEVRPREKATQNLLDFFLPQKNMLGLVGNLLDDSSYTYQKSDDFESIREFVGRIDFYLKIKKEDHKYDDSIDQKLVACVLDNQLVKKNKSAVVSRDNDVINLLYVATNIISSVGVFSEEIREFSMIPPFTYGMDTQGKILKRDGLRLDVHLSSLNNDDRKTISGHIGKHAIHLLEDVNFY